MTGRHWHNRGVELFTGWHDWAASEPEVRASLPADTADAVCAAVKFAKEWHGRQLRPTGAPYLEHLLETLEVLVCGARVRDRDVLCASILHDVLEDTPCPAGEIAAAFGPRVADLVRWVTIPAAGPSEDKSAVKEAYLRRLRDAPREAILVKLADRASNVQTLRRLPLPRQRAYYAQTVTFIVPLSEVDPWFARWYAEWREDFADLAAAAGPLP